MTSRGKSGEGSGKKVSGAFCPFVWGFSGLLSEPRGECPVRLQGEKGFFRFRVLPFCVGCPFPSISQNYPPLKIQYSMVFIGNVLLGFQTSPSTFPFLLFSSFFVNFDFSFFFVFFENEQYQCRLNEENQ
jgi:hypothetical protein